MFTFYTELLVWKFPAEDGSKFVWFAPDKFCGINIEYILRLANTEIGKYYNHWFITLLSSPEDRSSVNCSTGYKHLASVWCLVWFLTFQNVTPTMYVENIHTCRLFVLTLLCTWSWYECRFYTCKIFCPFITLALGHWLDKNCGNIRPGNR